MRWIYPLEGIAAAVLIGVGETLLTRSSMEEYIATFEKPAEIYPQFVKEERTRFNEGDQLKLWAIKNSGLLFLGKGRRLFFSEITKARFLQFRIYASGSMRPQFPYPAHSGGVQVASPFSPSRI